jgi:protoheme IX farnesyltransferase
MSIFSGTESPAAGPPARPATVSDRGRGPALGAAGFARFAWAVLLYNFPVILFGAFVRASGSGDGCGSHWPLCNGEVIPVAGQVKTVIEFSHRLMSGLDGFLVLGLFAAAIRRFPRGHRVRLGAGLVLFFTVIEALIGAALVRNGWVAQDDSVARASVLGLHLLNTFLLLGALSLTAWWAQGGAAPRWRGQGAMGGALVLGLFGTLLLGVSGAITALGDTLYPVRDHAEAIRQSLSPGAHFLVQLRVLHPLLATSVGLYLLLIAGLAMHLRPAPEVRRFGRAVVGLFFLQMAVGLVNVWLKAPIWMQIVHLLLADLLWVALVFLTAAALAEGVPQAERAKTGVAASDAPWAPGPGERVTWKDYLVLTKPRVISLLLFTTLAAMFIAAGGWPGLGLLGAVALGGYMAAGAANAINMVIDRDIDGKMRRTSLRPTVTRKIPTGHALLFGMALALGSFALLWAAANLLAAMLSLAGLVYYVIVYTLLLKRRTWHNIVIGGAAGAFPPLVGWAAVTGDLSWLAWYLFAIIFLWTPVHFWALALMIRDDYAEAGVPMLPVVRGERVTVIQIALYAVLTAIVSLLPMALQEVRGVYLASAVLLNLVLLLRAAQLLWRPGRPRAVSLYKYSMLYLALLFLAMAVDRAIHL